MLDGLLYIIFDMFKREHHNDDKDVQNLIGNLRKCLEHLQRYLLEVQLSQNIVMDDLQHTIAIVIQNFPRIKGFRQKLSSNMT